MYDVIVIGSGPAGSSCALFLAEKNLSVLVVEQFSLPRDKICAGAVPAAIIETFPFLKKEDFIALSRVKYTFRGTRPCERSTSSVKIYSVERRDFDYSILKEALSYRNCHFKENSRVSSVREYRDSITITTSDGFEARAKYGILACGSFSALSNSLPLGRKREFACATHMIVYPDKKTSSVYVGKVHIDFAFIQNGYAGIIPKKHYLTVCLYQNTLSPRSFLKKKTEEFLRSAGVDGIYGPFSMEAIEVYDPARILNTERIFLLGDAGSLVDPLSGEGIRHAIRSAQIAAETIDKLAGSKDEERKYSQRIRDEIGKELLIAKQFRRIAHAFPAITYGGLVNVPEEACDVLNGVISYSTLLERLKKRIFRKLGKALSLDFKPMIY